MTIKKKDKVVDKKRLEIGVACIFKGEEVLIQTRPEGKSFAGKWEFPGGKIEEGESARKCVYREIREELGINIKVGDMFFKDVHYFDKVVLVLLFHRCKLVGEAPCPKENQEIKWIKVEDFSKTKFLSTNYRILKKIKEIMMNKNN